MKRIAKLYDGTGGKQDTSSDQTPSSPITGSHRHTARAGPADLELARATLGMLSSQFNAQLAWWTHPQQLLHQAGEAWRESLALYEHGRGAAGSRRRTIWCRPSSRTNAFADPVWVQSPAFDITEGNFPELRPPAQDAYNSASGLSRHEQSAPISGSTTGSTPSRRPATSWTNPTGPAKARKSRLVAEPACGLEAFRVTPWRAIS